MVRISSVLLVALTSFAGVLAQSQCETSPTFLECRKNAFYDQNGLVGPTSAEAACASVVNQPNVYYDCLCVRYTAFAYCYTAYCPSNVGIVVGQSRTQYCDAAAAYKASSNTNTNAPLPPLPAFTNAPTNNPPINQPPVVSPKASPSTLVIVNGDVTQARVSYAAAGVSLLMAGIAIAFLQ